MSEDNELNIAELISPSRIYGPGLRTVIWVQGCSIHCPGCWNADLWDFTPKKKITFHKVLNMLKEPSIEGLTLLGGEPLDQAKSVLNLIQAIHAIGKTTMLYTGYEWSEIITDPIKKLAIQSADISIYGRYIHEQRSLFLKWRGSQNQTILFNNPDYQQHYQKMVDQNEIEVHFRSDGTIIMLGYPDKPMRSVIQNE